jgi:hypothetical protein
MNRRVENWGEVLGTDLLKVIGGEKLGKIF